jgi:hypothetical protein
MITLAVEELKATAKLLQKTKRPISGWRDLLTKRADDIDEYIALYHTKVNKIAESYTHTYINRYRDALEEIQNTEILEPIPEIIPIEREVPPRPFSIS